MTQPPNITPEELSRLIHAYISIRNPTIRNEFIRTVEYWASDQGQDPL